MQGLLFVLKNTVLQFILLFGVIGVSGLCLTLLSRWTNNVFRSFVWPTIGTYLFGWIGVPVHEFCHAVFCTLFFHEIKQIKWFDPNAKNGAHGSVTHTYQPWNLYHRVGHLFIGLGPVLLAPAFLALMAYFLVPEARGALIPAASWHDWWRALIPIVHTSTLKHYSFWIFAYLAVCISSQVELSNEDLKQAGQGVLPVLLILGVINLGSWALGFSWHARVIHAASVMTTWSSGVYAFAAFISLVNFLICATALGLTNKIWGRDFVNPFRS